jgi:hypothetical protein
LSYFLFPEDSGSTTSVILTRKYDKRSGCFKRGWYLEAYKFGVVYRLPIILPISEDLLVKLYSMKRILTNTISHWEIKVAEISAEILNGPRDIFTPQYFPIYLSLTKSAVEAHNTKSPLTYDFLTYYVKRFLSHWCYNERYLTTAEN